jgi:uracil-DNA glycosylase
MIKEELEKIVHPSWVNILLPLFNDSRMLSIQHKLGKMITLGKKFYPEKSNIFRVFRDVPLDKVKVVIIGQDPYIRFNQAIGRAFAVPKEMMNPPSLDIIFKEIKRDYQLDDNYNIDSTLESWSNQGVLLLNTALTVEEGKSNSHANDWLWFIKEVIDKLQEVTNGIIFVQWGTQAQTYNINEKLHYKLKACHPQAENYGSGKFIGCNHFSTINKILEKDNGREYKINWY